ncbi:hypothetical protein ACOSP7_032463 [Xanthoceras sorbifolium]|uniref:Glycosyltransferase n=1 Tax=Xanthoceras sorbifolium TaxID=99658 RepID=A0ABQ8H4F6_9ROSI|nr:hypothetical protein JRO89_XS14G0078900 [Xanthoceras sorbifolium]
MEQDIPPPPHVLIFPFPALGHVNSMLKLAEFLSIAGLRVTFLNSEYNHDRLTLHADVCSLYTRRFPGFQFKRITDGLPMDHPRIGDRFQEMLHSVRSVTPPLLKQMLTDDIKPPVNCIISDGFMSFVVDVANELGIPIIYFRTISACAFWAYFCIREIIDAGELPIQGKEDMDRLIKSVPGMETFLRCRDLPSFCRADDPLDRNIQLLMSETRSSPRAQGLILNTFDDLEGPILSQIRTHCPKIYTIGPLQAHLNTRVPSSSGTSTDSLQSTTNGFWEVDRSCMAWLDKQPPKTVVYVSFGSITTLSREEVIEFWYGLVNSNKRFLWVVRPDLVSGRDGESQVPEKLVEGTKERGYMVDWVPQEEVLAHRAVGGFLTHSGWNSTLESIVAAQPMICWPYFADQQVNSRFVSEVWKLGLDMKDVCDRKVVEKMVNDLMVERRGEFVKSADNMAKLARGSINEGGSSYSNLDRLKNDIKLITSQSTVI